MLKNYLSLQKHMTNLWNVGIRPQSEQNILIEFRLLESMYVTLNSHMNKDSIFVSVDCKIL